MQTTVAEMLGVTFPICAVSHCGDAVVVASDLAGSANELQLGARIGR
jgi:hypothetical protein